MRFEPIRYLDWIRENFDAAKINLVCSAVRRVRAEELGLTLEQVPLSAPGDVDDAELLQLLGEIYHARPGQLALTVGATAGIFLVLHALLQPGDEVLVETPQYEPLARIPQQIGAEVRWLERQFEKGCQLDLTALERTISRRTKVILLTNLHNPSAAATQTEKMRTIGQIAREHGAHVVCSEVYLDAAFDTPPLPACRLGDNMITLSSLSKTYGLGPLRIGWVVAEERVIEAVRRIEQYVYCETSYPSQRVALAALRRRSDLRRRALDLVRPNFQLLKDWVHSHSEVRWVEPEGGTVALIRLMHGIDSWEFHRLARDKYGTLVAPGEFFGAKGTIRIAFGGEPDQFHRGLENLSQALRESVRDKR